MAGERTLPGLGLTGFWNSATGGWKPGMDANLLVLSVAGQLTAKSRTTSLPTGANGDIYIVPSGAGSHPNEIALKDNGTWAYLTPTEGWRAWVADEDLIYTFDGAAWITPKQPIDLGTFVAGTPSASETVLKYTFTRAVTFLDEFAGAQAHAGVAATASTTFIVKKNGSSVGTVVFASSGTTGTFATTGTTVSFAAGDYLELVAPSSADATLANIGFTFAGWR